MKIIIDLKNKRVLQEDGPTIPLRSNIKFIGGTITDNEPDDTTVVDVLPGDGSTPITIPDFADIGSEYNYVKKIDDNTIEIRSDCENVSNEPRSATIPITPFNIQFGDEIEVTIEIVDYDNSGARFTHAYGRSIKFHARNDSNSLYGIDIMNISWGSQEKYSEDGKYCVKMMNDPYSPAIDYIGDWKVKMDNIRDKDGSDHGYYTRTLNNSAGTEYIRETYFNGYKVEALDIYYKGESYLGRGKGWLKFRIKEIKHKSTGN